MVPAGRPPVIASARFIPYMLPSGNLAPRFDEGRREGDLAHPWQDACVAAQVAVAATGEQALAAGLAVAGEGGNAVDAAMAAAWVALATEPGMVSLGGGGKIGEILGRNSDHLAALGLSLHMRHTTSEIRRKFGSI